MKRYVRSLVLILLVAAGYFIYQSGLYYDFQALAPRKFPELSNPKNITLVCNFQGSKLTIDQLLYGSVYEYYKADPKKRKSFYRDDNKAFVYNDENDRTLDEITTKITSEAAKRKLNSDQTLDLAACFIQNIPYDEVKAKKILDPNFSKYPIAEIIPRYPYETLYDNTGICTDKSYLGAAIFSRLGYGTALLSFDAERHLSLGISVPTAYKQYGNEYAIMELTDKGFLVGDLPMIKQSIGLAQNTIDEISSDAPKSDGDLKTISQASKVEVVSDGKSYNRIAERAELRSQISVLKKELEAAQDRIAVSQQDLKQAESEVKNAENYYKANPSRETYNTYTVIYNDYKTTYATANQAVASYNTLVTRYNALVQKYKNY